MILKNNSEKVIKLVRYYEILEFADKLRLSINIFESDYINIKSDKMLDLLKQILRIVDANYNKYGMINFLEYRHLLLMSAQVMEMTEKEQSMFVYEILYDLYKIISTNKIDWKKNNKFFNFLFYFILFYVRIQKEGGN